MKYLVSILATLVLGAAVVLMHLFGTEPLVSSVNTLAIIDAKGLAAVGCFVAMFQFAPRDYLRRAWGLLTIGSLLLVEVEVVVAIFTPVLSPEAMGYTRGGLLVIANFATPLAMVMFARALAVAGLDIAGTAKSRFAVNLLAAVIALVVAGPSALADIKGVLAGDPTRIAFVASDLGDIVSLMLVAPLIYNVATLRGGTLLWPFVMLTASRVAWLVYDGLVAFGELSGHTPQTEALRSGLRLTALMFVFLAGLAQRWALARTPTSSVHAADVAQAA